MYGFRGNGLHGLGDTCSDLATTWLQAMQQCQSSGISDTNPPCVAQNTAFASGASAGCDPALFVATQVAAANPTATTDQVATAVQQQVPTATPAQAQTAAATVVQPNLLPPSAGQTTPVPAVPSIPATPTNVCLFGDTSAPVAGLPVCAYTLYGGLALLALLLVMKK